MDTKCVSNYHNDPEKTVITLLIFTSSLLDIFYWSLLLINAAECKNLHNPRIRILKTNKKMS